MEASIVTGMVKRQKHLEVMPEITMKVKIKIRSCIATGIIKETGTAIRV